MGLEILFLLSVAIFLPFVSAGLALAALAFVAMLDAFAASALAAFAFAASATFVDAFTFAATSARVASSFFRCTVSASAANGEPFAGFFGAFARASFERTSFASVVADAGVRFVAPPVFASPVFAPPCFLAIAQPCRPPPNPASDRRATARETGERPPGGPQPTLTCRPSGSN